MPRIMRDDRDFRIEADSGDFVGRYQTLSVAFVVAGRSLQRHTTVDAFMGEHESGLPCCQLTDIITNPNIDLLWELAEGLSEEAPWVDTAKASMAHANDLLREYKARIDAEHAYECARIVSEDDAEAIEAMIEDQVGDFPYHGEWDDQAKWWREATAVIEAGG